MLRKILGQYKYQNWLPVALPFLLFVLHSLLFRDWIIDDAGISFAYARNLAHGNGLVSQPGMNPVEGFSNFTWVLILSPFFLLKVFNPILTPKIISLVLVLGSFITVQKILASMTKHFYLGTFVVLILLALNSSFVIWTISGLENPLYVFLISLILWHIIKYSRGEINWVKSIITISILSALCALTRPDGIIYAAIFPFFLLIDLIQGKNKPKEALKSLWIYIGTFLLVFGSYLVFRFFYFGDILPNTYYAKSSGLFLYPRIWMMALQGLLISLGMSKYIIIGIFALLIYLVIQRRITRPYFVLSITILVALSIYFLLPPDWMGEFRFATPFFLLFYIFLFSTSDMVYENTKLKKYTGPMIFLLIFLISSISTASFIARSCDFAKSPTVPFSEVAEYFGYRFNEYATAMGIENGSILAPDLGGTLYYSHLKVYDLAGLTDKVIALNMGKNQSVFYDYIFDELKPTFIHTHGFWDRKSNFDADPRFRENYIAIIETKDSGIPTDMGTTMFSGDYVRIDAVRDYDALLTIQSELTKP